jgi:hypothetical protein
MRKDTANMQKLITAITAGFVFALSAGPLAAEGATPIDPKLEARIAAEKEARKQCKVDICKVFATRSAEGAPIACDVTKTFLEGDISQRILSGRIGWPWGNAQCTTRVELDRAELAKTLAKPEGTIKLKAHELKCTVDNQKNGLGTGADGYALKVSVAPEVTFKNGKATEVKLNWSNIDAPMLAQGAIWTATTADSAINVMGGSAVTMINEFMGDHCKEVGVEVPQPK